MYCINCGKKVTSDAKYCPECGGNVSVSAESQNKLNQWRKPLWQQPLKYRILYFSAAIILVILALCVIAGDKTIADQSKYFLLGALITLTIFCTLFILIGWAVNKLQNKKIKIISLIISIIVLVFIFFGGLVWWGSNL